MNNLLSKFSQYLIDIGLANSDSIPYIQQLFNEIQSSKHPSSPLSPEPSVSPPTNNINEEAFKETMLATLMYYFSSLSEETKEKISLSLLLKFFTTNPNPKYTKLKSCILLCDAKHSKHPPKPSDKFTSWKSKTSTRFKPGSPHEISSYSSRRQQIRKSHNNSNNTNNHSYRQQPHIHHTSSSTDKKCPKYERLRIETSVDKKEKEDLNECTFHPDTTLSNSYYRPTSCVNDNNTLGNINSNNESVYDRLYKDGEKYESKRQIKKLELEHMLSEQYNFKPALLSTPNKFRRKSKIKFNERQKSFIDKKTQNKQKLQYIIDEDFNSKCSFSPKINATTTHCNSNNNKSEFIMHSKNISTPAHIRLYEDDKTRRMKTNQKIREINQQIAEQCNSFVSRRYDSGNTNNNNINSNGINNTSFSNSLNINNNNNNHNGVDTHKIEELYKQYKKRPAKIQRIRQAMEMENGITFEPYLNRNNQYYSKINTNVLERSEQMLQHKKEFVRAINEAQNRYWKENQYGYRKYSPLEKEEITQRIIQRLYGRGYLQNNNNNGSSSKGNDNYQFVDDDNNNNNNNNYYIRQGNGDEEECEMEMDVEDIQRDDNAYTDENRILNYEIQKGGENIHNEVIENEEEDEEDGRYNDKIISIDEYNFGKNKKKNYG